MWKLKMKPNNGRTVVHHRNKLVEGLQPQFYKTTTCYKLTQTSVTWRTFLMYLLTSLIKSNWLQAQLE